MKSIYILEYTNTKKDVMLHKTLTYLTHIVNITCLRVSDIIDFLSHRRSAFNENLHYERKCGVS